MKGLPRTVVGLVLVFFLVVGVLSTAAFIGQTLHDSCRVWPDPPPWSSFCPLSTTHGVK